MSGFESESVFLSLILSMILCLISSLTRSLPNSNQIDPPPLDIGIRTRGYSDTVAFGHVCMEHQEPVVAPMLTKPCELQEGYVTYAQQQLDVYSKR